MEASKRLTVDDLIQSEDERVEPIDGEIVRRPMARFDHALAQSALAYDVRDPLPWSRAQGHRPPPVAAPACRGPHYWILSPQDRTLIAYALDDGSYRLCYSVTYLPGETASKARIPPFESVEFDLDYLFGEGQAA